MSVALIILLVLIGVVVLFAIYAVVKYNGLVALRNKVEGAAAQIDVQLNRRHDLIPNLVETVKGYASHEAKTLEAVIAARNQATAAEGLPDKAAAENVLTGALKSLFAVSEAYPDLKANANFQQLQTELSTTEDRIAYSRQYYNDIVRTYNEDTQQFPANVLANMFHFSRREYFEADEVSRQNVQIDFGS
ncbi:MAG TPA: LemA family protein [Microthrixaceae bacterium]|nr:LemA family protein [Microthrixaceae bacterium]